MLGNFDVLGPVLGVAGVGAIVGGVVRTLLDVADFDRRRDEERERLRAGVEAAAQEVPEVSEEEDEEPKYADVGGSRPPPRAVALLGDKRDDFTPLLVEYYAYGLTQARSSFVTSQRFAGFGATILLLGVGLAVWKAESTGDLYLGVVTSSVGVVVTLIGQLFHRRADIALRHMSDQTASLRDDRRAAETTQQAIGLLAEVADPVLRARLQAGLIMKLSGAELPPADG
ncbi:hypothetical protein [Streptomyces sp. G-G2]|uniref:TRADD-N-associated membrane domain-containing protein n=1 Tax=Streptomyces sp. G-G2 TaxID=3046201 RepID=UPI0024B977F6|nr:hypothetical protein [Streptomyces sp. G-G2]MDJ0385872.1 hypothetical protein [Streptomyces sp. G-G2]